MRVRLNPIAFPSNRSKAGEHGVRPLFELADTKYEGSGWFWYQETLVTA